jgi:hypothetical protein
MLLIKMGKVHILGLQSSPAPVLRNFWPPKRQLQKCTEWQLYLSSFDYVSAIQILLIKGIKPQGKPWTLFSKATPPQADGALKTLINTGFVRPLKHYDFFVKHDINILPSLISNRSSSRGERDSTRSNIRALSLPSASWGSPFLLRMPGIISAS